MKKDFTIGSKVCVIDSTGTYFYLRETTISEKIISSRGITYNVDNGKDKLYGLPASKFSTKEEAVESLKRWLKY